MGGCNCTFGNSDIGSVIIDNKTIETREKILERPVDDSFEFTTPEVKLGSLINREITQEVQALVKGYLIRRNFCFPVINSSLNELYKSLGKFELGEIQENHINFHSGVYIGEINQLNEPHGCGRMFLDDKILEGH